ncbi:MAG TPA: CoA-transferase [Solirubrobacteraceae bacterium]
MSAPLGPRELMACLLADRLHDEEILIVGGASIVPMAAGLLAQRTHAPNLTLLTGSGAVNPRPRELVPGGGDYEYLRTAEAHFTMEDVFDDTERGRWDVAIFGGIQVDRHGNFNLTYVGGTLAHPHFRGPGFVNAGIATSARRFMLHCEQHTPRTLVAEVDFASGTGARRPDGGPYPPDRRGTGPDHCVTALACLRITAEGVFEVVSRHPGVTAEQLRRSTGFPVDVTDAVPITPTPDPEQLGVLRELIDPTGTLNEARRR